MTRRRGKHPTDHRASTADLGGLSREAPIGQGSPTEGGPSVPTVPDYEGPSEPASVREEFSGTVLNVTMPTWSPQSAGNPFLLCDVRTDSGETVTIRRRFLTAPFRVPHLAEGHHIRFAGDVTRRGYINPRFIDNETNDVQWRRINPLLLALFFVLVVAVLTFLFVNSTQ
jgi:hypothetical protein